MGKLEEQLRRAERKAAPAPVELKGGPVKGEPGDKWIAYHATVKTLFLAKMISIGSIALVAVILWLETDRQRGVPIAIVAALPTAIVWPIYLVKRSGAVRKERLYLSTLPFTLAGYLETMSEPRWWAKASYAVTYEPRLVITWLTPPGVDTVAKLATLADAKFRDGAFEASSWVTDPWRWTRKVIDEVVIPLREKSEVATAQLTVKRGVEYQSSD